MGFRTNSSQQISLIDRMNNLTEREQRYFAKTWAKPFAETIFPLIDESKFGVLYCKDNGRPNTPVNIIIGALFLKELAQLTDEELHESILFDTRFQYALHLTGYEEIPFSDRTLSRFRERLYWHESDTGEDLLKEEVERLSGSLAGLMQIRGSTRRMDSVMVSSSCKKMGRLELMYTCVSNLVKALAISGQSGVLPEHMLPYAEAENKNAYCYRLEAGEVDTRLAAITADAIVLYELAASLKDCADEFELLERMLQNQTANGKLKPNKQISPESLQNPSDEDATFRRKAGKGHQGYVGNLVEACDENGNIITHYDYDVNLHSDVAFAAETIERLGKQVEHTVLICDGAYSSEDNSNAANQNNIELATTCLTGQKPPEIILQFQISDHNIQFCPAGHAPIYAEYNEKKGEYRAHFDKSACENCPSKEECPSVIRKKNLSIVKLSTTSLQRAAYAVKLSTDDYKAYARKRNGVEGLPSILRRRYHVDNMPVRGLVRSKMWFGFKIGAINIKRMIAFILNASVSIISFAFLRSCLNNKHRLSTFLHLHVESLFF